MTGKPDLTYFFRKSLIVSGLIKCVRLRRLRTKGRLFEKNAVFGELL